MLFNVTFNLFEFALHFMNLIMYTGAEPLQCLQIVYYDHAELCLLLLIAS